MKHTVLYSLVIIIALLSCGAADGPDAPDDIVIDVISNPLNPLDDICKYQVRLFKVDSLPDTFPDSQLVTVTRGGRLSMTFTAPSKFVEVDTTTETSGNWLTEIRNENVGYTHIDELIQAYMEFTVYADTGLYMIRTKAIGTNLKHGKLSAADKNFVEVK